MGTTSTYPKVVFNLVHRVPPRIVKSAEEEAGLNPFEWSPIPLATPKASDEFPQFFFNVNNPPVVAYFQEEVDALGDAWVQWYPPIPDVPPVSIDPTEATAAAAGGTDSFSVTITGVGQSGTWTASKDAEDDWITIDSPTTPQSSSGEVSYSVDPNTGAERTGNIYVNGKTFTITQAALGGA